MKQIDIIKKSHEAKPVATAPAAEPTPPVKSHPVVAEEPKAAPVASAPTLPTAKPPKESASIAISVITLLTFIIVLLLAGVYYFYSTP